MTTFTAMLSHVALFALLAVPGFLLGRLGMIERGAVPSMSNILMYVAMPCLVFSALCSADLTALSLADLAACALIPVLLELALAGVTALLFPGAGDRGRGAACRFCSIFSNCGFLGIPLAAAVYPDAPEVTVFVSLFNVFSSLLLWTLGVYILSGDRRCVSPKKALLNPLSAAIVLGVIASRFAPAGGTFFPETYASLLAQVTTPLSMLVLGAELADLRPAGLRPTQRLWLTLAVKLLACPLLTLLLAELAGLLPGAAFSPALKPALFLASAVSTAASAPAMAQRYGADGEYASLLTMATTLACVLTLPCLAALLGLRV